MWSVLEKPFFQLFRYIVCSCNNNIIGGLDMLCLGTLGLRHFGGVVDAFLTVHFQSKCLCLPHVNLCNNSVTNRGISYIQQICHCMYFSLA